MVDCRDCRPRKGKPTPLQSGRMSCGLHEGVEYRNEDDTAYIACFADREYGNRARGWELYGWIGVSSTKWPHHVPEFDLARTSRSHDSRTWKYRSPRIHCCPTHLHCLTRSQSRSAGALLCSVFLAFQHCREYHGLRCRFLHFDRYLRRCQAA